MLDPEVAFGLTKTEGLHQVSRIRTTRARSRSGTVSAPTAHRQEFRPGSRADLPYTLLELMGGASYMPPEQAIGGEVTPWACLTMINGKN